MTVKKFLAQSIIFVSLFLTSLPLAIADSFISAHTSWRRVSDNGDGSVTVEFKSQQAWTNTSATSVPLEIDPGDGTAPKSALSFTKSDATTISGIPYLVFEFEVQHTYTAADIAAKAGVFIADVEPVSRFEPIKNADKVTSFPVRVQTVVDLNSNNSGSPVIDSPPVFQFMKGQVVTFNIAAGDPDSEQLKCRMATLKETAVISDISGTAFPSSIFEIASAGGQSLSVDSNCFLSWDTTSTKVGEFYAAQVFVEESNRCNGSKCGATAIDFLIEIIEDPLSQPECDSLPYFTQISALEAGSTTLRNTVQRVIKKFQQEGGDDVKKKVKNLRTKMSTNFKNLSTFRTQLNPIVTTCDPHSSCRLNSSIEYFVGFTDSANKLRNLVKSALKEIQRIGEEDKAYSKKQRKNADKQYDALIATLNQIPSSTTFCGN